MATTVADVVVETLKASGVRRVYGLPGDSINGFTDALRRDGEIVVGARSPRGGGGVRRRRRGGGDRASSRCAPRAAVPATCT